MREPLRATQCQHEDQCRKRADAGDAGKPFNR